MAGFVIRGDLLLFFREQQALALSAHQDLVLGQLKVIHQHGFAIVAGSVQRRFIHHVGKLGAGEARSAARQNGEINIVRQGNLAGMYAENFFTSTNIWKWNHNAAIKASWTQQRGIEHVWPVGGGDQDHPFIRFKAVHLDEQLVECLFTLVVSAAQACATMASNGINFIDEDNARSVLLALFKQVAYAACAYTHEHLNKV